MSSFKDLPPGSSRLTRQLAALGFAGDASTQAADAERQALARLPLRPLRLAPRRGWRPRAGQPWWTAAALAAGVTLAVVRGWPSRPLDHDVLTGKGGAAVTVYWERQGAVGTVEPGTVLVAGDRVRADVATGADAVAVLAVFDRRGRLLTDRAGMLQGAVWVRAGQVRAFPASFRLVGPSDGEQLLVAVCPAPDLESGRTVLTTKLGGATSAEALQAALRGGCELAITPLR